MAVALGVSVLMAWRGAKREQAQLQAKLNSAEQLLRDADARQETRKVELGQQLVVIRKKKAAVLSPQQVVKALPEVLPLPEPLVIEEESQSDGTTRPGVTGKPNSPSPKVTLPAEDLKPLYDAALDCQACQAELEVAQADLADEKTKTEALSRERDDALQVAKGGSVLQRVRRAAKWFAIGVAAGAVVAKAAH